MNKLVTAFLLLFVGGLSAQPTFPPATQSEVNAGTLPSKFVSPATLAGWTGVGNTLRLVDYQIITNYQQQIVHSAGDTTNLQIAVTTTNVIFWAPSNNCSLTVIGSWSDRNQTIVISLALTNPNITSVVLPFLGPNSEQIPLRSVPSTNEVTIRSNGRYQWIVTDSSLYRPTAPAPVINGYDWNSIMDAVAVSQTGPGTGIEGLGGWVLNEEFWLSADTAGQIGREYWSRSVGATTVTTNQGAGGSVMFGEVCVNPRTAGARWCAWLGMSSATGVNRLTNSEVLTITRMETSSLDNTTVGTNTIREGWLNQIASESTSGVYWRSTNNNWQLITARNGTYTTTASLSNVVAGAAQIKATFLDSTGTNVYGFIGTTPWNMACVATNSLNIPHDFPVQPSFFTYMVLTNVAWATGVSNRLDYFKIWARRR